MSRPVNRLRSRRVSVPRLNPELLAELAYRLTSRDRLVLELVWEHRVLTTHQLAAIHFSSPGKARHRLLELYRLAALERFQPWTPTGSAPWHWVLGPAGAHALAAQRGIEPTALGYRRDTTLAISHSRKLGHQIGVNEFFAQLHHQARRQGSIAAITEWWSEQRCAALWGDLARPDAYGRWTENHPDGAITELDFFLEHDTGSETVARVASKVAGYTALAESTGIATPVLFWLPSKARETNLRKAIESSEVPVATAVQTTATDPEGPAGRNWLPVGSSGPVLHLIDLANAWPSTALRPDQGDTQEAR